MIKNYTYMKEIFNYSKYNFHKYKKSKEVYEGKIIQLDQLPQKKWESIQMLNYNVVPPETYIIKDK